LNRISIIIPSFNGRQLLEDCIYSIKQYTDIPYEIIVVDNGSNDGTTDFCRQEGIIFVSLPENKGFPAACNIGLKVASGDTLLLLNNDVLVTPHLLSNMMNCLYSSEDIGIVGPLTNYASGKQQIEMPFDNTTDVAEQFNQINREKWQPVERIVGLCFLFKRELMERNGLLDEQFTPGHYEDDDYCYRARLAGYRLMIACDAFIYHLGSSSFGKQDQQAVKDLLARNHQKFMDKWGVDPILFI
jgi:GT2 family glycosyltransferase